VNLKDKVALITGSSSRIGRSAAYAFSRKGYAVVVHYKSNREGGLETVRKIHKTGGEAILVQANLSNEDEVKKTFKKVMKDFGRLDILINNAGKGLPTIIEKNNKQHSLILMAQDLRREIL